MKGLILKDLYMAAKYCRAYLLIIAVFISVSFFGNYVFLFIFYPCLLAGMVPMTLLSYDERCGWTEYCWTMPITAVQIVSAKYLIGLIFYFCTLILSGIVQAVRLNLNGIFQLSDYLSFLAMLVIMSCVATAGTLPFMFRFGVEKGRIAYYFTIALVCGGSVAASNVFNLNSENSVSLNGAFPILCAVAVAIYALSWYLSIVFYKKRISK